MGAGDTFRIRPNFQMCKAFGNTDLGTGRSLFGPQACGTGGGDMKPFVLQPAGLVVKPLPWPPEQAVAHTPNPYSWDSVSQWRFSIRAGWTVRRAETKVKRHWSQKPTSLAFDFANVNGQFAIVCANAPSQKSNGCVTEIPCRPSYGSVTSV